MLDGATGYKVGDSDDIDTNSSSGKQMFAAAALFRVIPLYMDGRIGKEKASGAICLTEQAN